MIFEWSELKSQRNKVKHRVLFGEAVSVFKNGLGRIVSDPDHSLDEERFILLGVSSKLRLLVFFFVKKNQT